MTSYTRRDTLAGAIGIGLSASLAASPVRSSSGSIFKLGIASGDPWPDGVVLWTRLVRDAVAADGGMGEAPVEVVWEVARDERLQDVVRTGVTLAMPEFAHSVHVEVSGLEPGRSYWYRFRAENTESPIGRTRTAPAPGQQVSRLRFAAAACQHWMYGNWAAYHRMADEDLDFVLHLGDYIYEAPSSSQAAVRQKVRDVPIDVPKTLADYRRMHSWYKTDPAIQSAHSAFPWIAIWDDHDVENDYAGNQAPGRPPAAAFLRQRAAAYQAYWEHMPLRIAQRPLGPDALLYRRLAFGDLIDLIMLDERQYRSPLACPPPAPQLDRSRLVSASECADAFDPKRTMLGLDQESWLARCLTEPARGRWLLLGQQLMFSPFARKLEIGTGLDTDGWGGYAAAHQRMVDLIAARPSRDTVVLGGDIHGFVASNVPAGHQDMDSDVVAAHIVCGAISSRLGDHSNYVASLPNNPHIQFVDAQRHGYTRCTFTRDRASFEFRAVDDIRNPVSGLSTLATFETEWGVAGLRRV
ncbi:Twin-arginine translocation pathway signal precursor [Bosea sp. LC85]|uniref:alkaline phosphatase D family protein n=1 Tax=Bosea sp. LC85 TaxID=1502851 RepID=UPI0004E3001E|nr:alkaline phosphatase D family protein [Bosea sp. LC85]KFC69038.1 Twin-arginine translocation pathway signal precursor [Bosea sp. LC85]